MLNKENWSQTKKNFIAWWNGEDIGRPLLWLVSQKADGDNNNVLTPASIKDRYIDPVYRYNFYKSEAENRLFHAESYPYIEMDIGPGSYAIYLGCEPTFSQDTVWFKHCIESYDTFELKYDKDNYWLKKHLEIIKKVHELANGEMIIHVPDIVENIDILASMRNPQTLLYDMLDYPEIVEKYISFIDANYMKVYNQFYDIVKDKDGGSAYTVFRVWGPGRTAKVQCDFSAMISPDHFRRFVMPTLEKQCSMLDYTIYHLDGPDCIRHLPALMEIDHIDALQWTAGAGHPDGANPQWYEIYRQVRDAGKSLWVEISDGSFEDWVKSAKRFVNEFGRQGVYFLFPTMEQKQAEILLDMSYDW